MSHLRWSVCVHPRVWNVFFFFFFSREEAGLHVRQQELPQCVFGPGSGGYSRTSPGAGSEGRSLGHITGAVSQRYMYASFPSEQVKLLSAADLGFFCKHIDDIVCSMMLLPRNILSFALNFCITRVPRNHPIGEKENSDQLSLWHICNAGKLSMHWILKV